MTVGRIEGHCPRKGVRSAVIKHSSSPEREWIAHCPGLARLLAGPDVRDPIPPPDTVAPRQRDRSAGASRGLALPTTSRVSALDRMRLSGPSHQPAGTGFDALACAGQRSAGRRFCRRCG